MEQYDSKWNNKISKTPTFKADSIKHLIHLAASSELLAPNLKTLVNRQREILLSQTKQSNTSCPMKGVEHYSLP